MAVRNDWLKQDPFVKFKPKFIKKDRGFLTETELAIIESKDIHNASLAHRERFICFFLLHGFSFC
jgi:integrase/recombinase XerD